MLFLFCRLPLSYKWVSWVTCCAVMIVISSPFDLAVKIGPKDAKEVPEIKHLYSRWCKVSITFLRNIHHFANDKANYKYIIHLLPLTIPLFGGIFIWDVWVLRDILLLVILSRLFSELVDILEAPRDDVTEEAGKIF